MKLKKLLALVLALMMAFSCFSVAWAGEGIPDGDYEEEYYEDEVPVEEDDVYYDEEVVEEPEESELVGADVGSVTKVTVNYGGSPQENTVLNMENGGVMTKAYEESIAPEAWEGHTFKYWTVNDSATQIASDKLRETVVHDDKEKGVFEDGDTITAHWDSEKFDVLFKKGTEAAGDYLPDNMTDETAVEYGTIITPEVKNAEIVGYDYTKPIFKVDGEVIDITKYAIKAKTVITIEIPLQKIPVKFLLDADDEDPYSTVEVDYGTVVAAPETPTDDHRTFNEWQLNGSTFDFKTKITEETTLVADWTAEKVKVTFDANGGTVGGQSTLVVDVDYNKPIGSAPEAILEGTTFISWQLDGEDFDTTSEKITTPITLKAHYLTNSVTLTYTKATYDPNPEVWPKDDQDEEISEKKQSGEWGTAFKAFEDVTREGYTLDGWWDGKTLDKDGNKVKFDFSSVKEDTELTAIWKANEITITLATGHDGVKFDDGTEKGKDVQATITAKYDDVMQAVDKDSTSTAAVKILPLKNISGFEFVKWYYLTEDGYGDPAKNEFKVNDTLILKEDITLYADWDEYYTVTLYDGVDADGKDIPFVDEALTNGQILFYVKDYQDGVKFEKTVAERIYNKIDTEVLEDKATYCEGFFNGDTEFDLAKDEITGDLTLKTKRLDVVKVTINHNDGTENKTIVYYPKGKSLSDADSLRGNIKPENAADDWEPRIIVPTLTRDHYTFTGYLNGTEVFGEDDPIEKDIELDAQWEGQMWTVTLDLDGGSYDYPTVYTKVVDGTTVTLKGEPTKTDCLFDKWVTREFNEDGTIKTETEFVSNTTIVNDNITVYATWTTYAAKDKAAKDPTTDVDKYFATLSDALADTSAADIVVLQNLEGTLKGDNSISVASNIKSIDLNGNTITLGSTTISGNTDNAPIIKNGVIAGGTVSYVKIASGTYENVTIGDMGAESISGGKFRWINESGEDISEEVAAEINETGYVVEGKKLHPKNGYYTPVGYKTLTIKVGTDETLVDGEKTYTSGQTDTKDVFTGEVTVEPEISKGTAKFDKWLVEAEGDEDPAEFVFGEALTEDTTIYATWIESATVYFSVNNQMIPGYYYRWSISTYTDQLIVEPVEPTEDEYAEMSKSDEEKARAAWEVINSDGFLGWRYETTNKNVNFGKDKAEAPYTYIYAASKHTVTFYGLGDKVLKVIYLDDGETVGLNNMPTAPEEEGYTFNGDWLVDENSETAEVFRPATEKIYKDYKIYASYSTGNWTISAVDTDLSNGHSNLPSKDSLTFGGDKALTLIAAQSNANGLEKGKYYIAFEITAPNSVGDLSDNINEVKWVYKTDDESWKDFNVKQGQNYDEKNGSGQLVLKMYKEVTWDMLKELVDTESVKTYTITFAPDDQKDEESAYVTFTVTLDPRDVLMYTGPRTEPVHGIINYRYMFTVTFDMDGGAAIKPVATYEYGDPFVTMKDGKPDYTKFEFEDKELSFDNPEINSSIKEYYSFTHFGYYKNADDKELSPIDGTAVQLFIKDDTTVYAMYDPVKLYVEFYDNDGNYLNETEFALGSAMNELVVPENIIGKYGTDDWHPVMLKAPEYSVDKKTIAAEAYDINSTSIVGDVYLTEDEKTCYIMDIEGDYFLNLIRGDELGYEVIFLGSELKNGYRQPLTDIYYPADEDGDVTFGELEIPEYKPAQNEIFDGDWILLDTSHISEFKWSDLKPFDFEKNADKSIKDKLIQNYTPLSKTNVLVFAPVVTNTDAGQATLYSANVEFDGLIHLIFKYGFEQLQNVNREDNYVVFRTGDTELARVPLSEGTYSDGRVLFTCPVPIVNYTDTINVRVENADGEEWATKTGKGVDVVGGYDYSLQTYAENKESSTNPKMAALAKALQDYGIATRLYAGRPVGSLVLSDAVKNLDVASMDVTATETTPKEERPEGVSASQTVIFESDNTLQVTFTVGSGDYEFRLDGAAVNVAPDADGKVVLKVPNIAPNALNTRHTFSCSDGTKTFDITTSVLGYAKRSAEKGSDAMKNLAKALYLYSKAADAYAQAQ